MKKMLSGLLISFLWMMSAHADMMQQSPQVTSEKLFAVPYLPDRVINKAINFDVVVDNPYYTIYRSSLLGRMGLAALAETLKRQDRPFPKTIVYMNKQGYNRWYPPLLGNFAMEEYFGQEEYGYRFYHSFDYAQRTYLDGHDPYHPKDDIDAERFLLGSKAKEIFGTLEDSQLDGGIDSFLRIMELVLDEKNSPILFHCFGGRHRTGMVALALRYLQGGHWLNGPKKEVTISYLGKTLSLNPAQYEYYVHNKDMVRIENLDFIEKFSQDPRFFDLQDRFASQLRAPSAQSVLPIHK